MMVSQLNVVSIDCGLKWMWSQMNVISMNVVSIFCGLKWRSSQMKKSHVNVVANEQVSKERGLKWSGLEWIGLNSHVTADEIKARQMWSFSQDRFEIV